MEMTILKKIFKDQTGINKLQILRSPIFFVVLGLKLFCSAFFASNFLVKLFAPFVNYFIINGFSNPYQFFFNSGVHNAFPYPNVMLWFLAIPRLIFNQFLSDNYLNVTNFHLFIFRLPILLADFVIFIILIRWLKRSQDKVLWFYWCSPVLFYINYLHGQLDVIPMMLLFVSLYWLFKEKFTCAMVFLGLAVSAKTGILIAFPFIFVFLILRQVRWSKALMLSAIVPLVFFILNFNYLFSDGFVNLVLNNQEQSKIFDVSYFLGGGLTIYFVPLAYLLIFITSLSFKSFSRSLFLMFLGFAFGILTLLVPPMPGWYYWVMPFFIYFYIKEENAPIFSFVLLNILYFAYFIINKTSDFPNFLQPIFSNLASKGNLYFVLHSYHINADLLVSVVFSLLQGILLLNVVWIYRRGVLNHTRHKIKYQPYLIGVSGDSGSGKTTFSNLLTDIFSERNLSIVRGDDLHRWERGDSNWKDFTHLDPLANRLHYGLEQAESLKNGEDVDRQMYDHATGNFTSPRTIYSKRVVVFEGLHTFYLNDMRRIFDLKIFLQPEESIRYAWKIARDMEQRGYAREKILEQLKLREADSIQYVQKQEQFADITITFCSVEPEINVYNFDKLPELYLKFKFRHEVNIDPMLVLLRTFPDVQIKHHYDDDFQYFEAKGKLSLNDILILAHQLVPDLDEVVTDTPVWKENYEGLIQLFINYYIFRKANQV